MRHCKDCHAGLVGATERSPRAERVDGRCTLCAAKKGDPAAVYSVREMARLGDREALTALPDMPTFAQ